MPNHPAPDHETERNADRIRQSIRHILTAPRASASNSRHAFFGALSSSGTCRTDMTEQAVQLSARHVLGEREPRVTDIVIKPKLQHGKLVSLAVSYTIKASRKRDALAISY